MNGLQIRQPSVCLFETQIQPCDLFWNGNRSGKFEGETWQEVPSDVVPLSNPWMKAAEITDAMIAALKTGPVQDSALQLREW
ncbi:MAG: hypothetical protein U5M23_08535 [Marinagarivorans sp.]|nr:hypothetical protein [Marinagarivorans sp.]